MKGPEGRTTKSSLLLPNKSGYGTTTTHFEAPQPRSKPNAGSRASELDEEDYTEGKRFSRGPSHSFFSGSPSTTASMASERKSRMSLTPSSSSFSVMFLLYCVIYALINVVISVPGLYGYAAVIFNHKVFTPHMNALSKLVISSSFMHQLSFTLFSSLPFAIGTVQDAGLIFLSAMSDKIATIILKRDNGTEEEVISTVLVLLSVGTATLGLVLIAMGHFRLADAVSYLPMPVVGGYLAFIGYFCLEAGVGLSISKPMTGIGDWAYLLQPDLLLLAAPALVAGLVLTWFSRNATNDAMLPLAMVAIPAIFYVVIYSTGIGLDGAREAGWVGEVAPPVPVADLVGLVDISLVRWDLIADVFPIWVGMVFVVSFASCLDVAAISIDMGEALDTNKELRTVGIGNLASGLCLGFTGSYIFSQTIFTYRTGVHSRLIGVLIMVVFAYVVASPVNILQIAPLFFLGSTLIFIGYDLLYEWLFEIRGRLYLTEYLICLSTFLAIQFVGMDAGILIGVLVAIVDHVIHSAKTLEVVRVNKKSRAVRSPEEQKILQYQGYHLDAPKIVTLEVAGSVFFGSSLYLFQRLMDELGVDPHQEDEQATHVFKSPHTPSFILLKEKGRSLSTSRPDTQRLIARRTPPKYLVIDLTRLHNLDATAAQGCFLQLVKICSKRGIIVCACGASMRVDWMLRSHGVAYSLEEEFKVKKMYRDVHFKYEQLILFMTIHEALVFCEDALVHSMGRHNRNLRNHFLRAQEEGNTLAEVFSRILGCTPEEKKTLEILNGMRYHQEIKYKTGEVVFTRNTNADAFFVVLKGAVAVSIDSDDPRHNLRSNRQIVSGAGLVTQTGSSSNLLDPLWEESASGSTLVVASVWPPGSVFGYVDCLLERERHFTAVATQPRTTVAKITSSHMQMIQREQSQLDALLQRVLLQQSLLDLANCTCEE